MSDRSRAHPRRSVLVVPGSSDRFVAKAPSVAADVVLLDLEDGVAPAERVAARGRVAAAVRSLDWGDRVVCVRVNAWSGDATFRDVVEVVGAAGSRLDTVMLPKARRASEIVALELLLGQVERECGLPEGHVGIEALVETAPALAEVQALCGASARLESVALGPADMGAALGFPTLTIGAMPRDGAVDPYVHVLGAILVAARANGLQAIDGPYAGLGDEAALRSAAERSKLLGYDGKWAIHPDQVAALNEVYSPSEAEVDQALRIADAFAIAVGEGGRGAVRFEGEMIDEATRQLALRTIERARHAGRDLPVAQGRTPRA